MIPQLTLEEAQRCVKAVEQKLREGYPPKAMKGAHLKSAIRAAGDELGMNDQTFRQRILEVIPRMYGLKPNWDLYQPKEEVTEPALVAPDHNLNFWRNRATMLSRELHKTEKMLEEISGLSQPPISVPQWVTTPPSGNRRSAVVGCLITDMHYGEVIDPEEVMGLNAFNPEIAERRMRTYFDAVCAIGPRWASDSNLLGVIVVIGGDLISGDIHEELRITNSLTSIEQVRGAVSVLTAGLTQLANEFGKVFVATVAGNHGRQTHKPTAKLYARLNYDTLICQMVQDALGADTRITFQIATGRDNSFPIFNRTVFVNHGDGLGTAGGMGFAGPLLPIVRGTKKVEAQQARAGRRPDLILHGHYHHSANPGPVLSNGSVPGYSEYGNGLRAAIEPPQQWAFLLHEKWWLRERAEIKLEDPKMPEKPVHRVPANMSSA